MPRTWLYRSVFCVLACLIAALVVAGCRASPTETKSIQVRARWLAASESIWNLEVTWQGPIPTQMPLIEAICFWPDKLPSLRNLGLIALPAEVEVAEKTENNVRWIVKFPRPDAHTFNDVYVRILSLDPPGIWQFQFHTAPDI